MIFTRLFIVLFISGTVVTAQGQQTVLRGTVSDSASGQIMEEATLNLYQLPKNILLGSLRSDTAFTISKLSKGRYMMVTSYQGYLNDTTKFMVNAKDSLAILHIQMKIDLHELMQVVVQARIPPAIIRNDTIAFNAGAYPSPANSTVEDLLRKLPGVEIDKDGNVTMQGRKVDKITIDGKDFFLDDLRNATQNLPADLVAQVEVFDSRSEKSKLTGIKEQSNTKTINLRLRKKVQTSIFGKVYGGLGTDQAYTAGGNITRLAGDQMIFASGNTNNINNQFTGSEHFNGPGAGEQVLNNLQLNYRNVWAKKFTAVVTAGENYNNSDVNQQLSRRTATGDSSILQQTASSAQNRNRVYNVNGEFLWAIDTLTQLNLHSSYSYNRNNSRTTDTTSIGTQKKDLTYISSLGKTDNDVSGSNNNFNNSLDFRHAFLKKGRQFYMNIGESTSGGNQPAQLFSLLKNFDSAENVLSNVLINQQSTQTTTNNAYSVNASYTEPVGKRHILDFGYSLNHSGGHSDKESFDYDSLTGLYDKPDSLTTNRFLNHSTVQGFNAGYNTTEGKYQFQVGLTAQLSDLDNLNLVNNVDLHQQTLNWFPRASLIWEIKKGENVSLNYSGSTSTPTLDQLQPVPDLTNPYLIKVGNPDLKQQLTHNLSASYADFNSKTFQNWQIYVNGDYAQNQITSSTTVLAGGVQELEYVNVSGVYHGSVNATYGFPLGGQKNGNASLSAQGNYGHDVSLINQVENTTINTGVGGQAHVNFHVKEKLFIDLETGVHQTWSHYSLPGSADAQTLNENYSLNLNYKLPAAVTVATYYNLQITGSQPNLPAQSVSLWNAAVYKTVFNNHCEFRLSAYDILNSAKSFSQSTGINYIQTQSTNLQGRIILCSVIYRFRKFVG